MYYIVYCTQYRAITRHTRCTVKSTTHVSLLANMGSVSTCHTKWNKAKREGRVVLLSLCWPMRPMARGLAQHGGPPGWLEESDPAGCDFVRDGRSMPPALRGPHHMPWSGASITKCTQNTVMSYVRKARPGTLVGPCLLSGTDGGAMPTTAKKSGHLYFSSTTDFTPQTTPRLYQHVSGLFPVFDTYILL